MDPQTCDTTRLWTELEDRKEDAAPRLFEPLNMVELRCFGGLPAEETAEAPRIPPDTVKRDWPVEMAWLHGEVTRESPVQ